MKPAAAFPQLPCNASTGSIPVAFRAGAERFAKLAAGPSQVQPLEAAPVAIDLKQGIYLSGYRCSISPALTSGGV